MNRTDPSGRYAVPRQPDPDPEPSPSCGDLCEVARLVAYVTIPFVVAQQVLFLVPVRYDYKGEGVPAISNQTNALLAQQNCIQNPVGALVGEAASSATGVNEKLGCYFRARCTCPDGLPVQNVRVSDMPAIATHIAVAQFVGYPCVLTYAGPNDPDSDRRRRSACGAARYRPGSCDEYPYATTLEGGAFASTAPYLSANKGHRVD